MGKPKVGPPKRPVLLKDKGNAYTDLRRRLEASIRALNDQEAQVLGELEAARREQQLLLEMLLSADLTLALLEAPSAAPPNTHRQPASPAPAWPHGSGALAHSPSLGSLGERTPSLGGAGGGGDGLSGGLLGVDCGQPCCWQLLELDGMDAELGGQLLPAPVAALGGGADSDASTLEGACVSCAHQRQHSAQQQQAAAPASSASSARRGGSIGGGHHAAAVASSYAAQLLQAATHAQLQCVVGMSAADWSQRFSTTFAKLLLLLEVATRVDPCGGDANGQAPAHAAVGAAAGGAAVTVAAAAAAAAPAPAPAPAPAAAGAGHLEPVMARSGSTSARSPMWRMRGMASPVGSPCVLGIEHSWEHGGSNSPGSSATGTAPHMPLALAGGAGTGFSAPGVDASSDVLQLQHLVDEWLTLTLLARIHNPLPLYRAAAMNHATKQAGAAAPHAHWRHVASRLGVTAAQRQHLGMAWHQFLRQRQVAGAQAAALAAEVAAGNTDGPCAERSSTAAPDALLQRCVRAFPLHALQLVAAMSNTLTGVQLAQLLVASWPFMALEEAVVEAVVVCQPAASAAAAAAVPGGAAAACGCCCHGLWTHRQLLNDQHIMARLLLLEQQHSSWQAAAGDVYAAAEGAVER